jgi:hypothetical protein
MPDKLLGVVAQAIHEAALGFGVDGIKGEAGFSAT